MSLREQCSISSEVTHSYRCAVCHRQNEQILVLSCSHDPCIACAALHYFQGTDVQQDLKLNERQIYWCQVCFEPTPIDSASIAELNLYIQRKLKQRRAKYEKDVLKRAKSLKLRTPQRQSSVERSNDYYDFIPVSLKASKSNQKIKGILEYQRHNDQMKSSRDYSPSQTPTEDKLKDARSNKKLQSILKYSNPCRKHEDQLQSYYCFRCLRSVCVECALHGSHVGHEVEAVKKAGPKLRGMYEQILQQSQKHKFLLQSQLKEINRTVEEIQAWNGDQERIIRQRFSELYDVLTQKQKSLLAELHHNRDEAMKRLKSQRHIYDKTIGELKNLRKELKKNLSSDPATWDITELQGQKALIKNLTQTKLKNLASSRRNTSEIKYLESHLVVEAIDTIEELVSTFKLKKRHGEPSQTRLI